MDDFMALAAHNCLSAAVLAAIVFALARVWRRPPVLHALWVLVLLKLVTPPMVHVGLPTFGLGQPSASADSGDEAVGEIAPTIAGPAQLSPSIDISNAVPAQPSVKPVAMRIEWVVLGETIWDRARRITAALWFTVTLLAALVVVVRAARFERRVREMLPASRRMKCLAREVAGKLGVRAPVDVRCSHAINVPLLWCLGRRPRVVLPLRGFDHKDEKKMALILAHELAHWRRRDHWARGAELLVSVIYWWNPLVWLIRRQIHQAEEQCCDAWVRWAFPERTTMYAELVFETAESLGRRAVRSPLPACPFMRSLTTKERIQMILEGRFLPRVSKLAAFSIVALALVLLPLSVGPSGVQARAAAEDQPAATRPAAANARLGVVPTSELPYAVKFERGVTKFLNGDDIKIEEVRGTADTFVPGNIYWIKGTYTLASRDRAILLASATVKDPDIGVLGLQDLRVRSDYFHPGLGSDPGNVTGVELKVQRAEVTRGTGAFTLFFGTTPFGGFPHVSFCSVEKGGASFGGAYFGTGDFVLKQWWNTDPISKMPEPRADTEYSHVLKFEQGAARFLDGDRITVKEIRGTSDTFAPDNFYQITGTYSLVSHDRATLAAYTTAKDAAHGRSIPSKVQSTRVNRGDGTFTLVLPMTHTGWPHVSFYPDDGGSGFGGTYFGTGESVLKRWWGEKE